MVVETVQVNVNQPLAPSPHRWKAGYTSSRLPLNFGGIVGPVVGFVGAKRGVIAPSIAIAVNELTSMFGECVFAVCPSIVSWSGQPKVPPWVDMP